MYNTNQPYSYYNTKWKKGKKCYISTIYMVCQPTLKRILPPELQ